MLTPFYTRWLCLKCGAPWWDDPDPKLRKPCRFCVPVRIVDDGGREWIEMPIAAEVSVLDKIGSRVG